MKMVGLADRSSGEAAPASKPNASAASLSRPVLAADHAAVRNDAGAPTWKFTRLPPVELASAIRDARDDASAAAPPRASLIPTIWPDDVFGKIPTDWDADVVPVLLRNAALPAR